MQDVSGLEYVASSDVFRSFEAQNDGFALLPVTTSTVLVPVGIDDAFTAAIFSISVEEVRRHDKRVGIVCL